jgi:ABC-type polysaccharide/polyol phosphate export permease
MTELQSILRLARNDFSYFFRTKWLMAILLSLNISDMLVVALVYSHGMINTGIIANYFQFFVPSVVIMGLFAAALDTGRRIWLAIREGVVQYYLSLPISLEGIVVAYMLAGGLAAVVYSSALLFIMIPVQALGLIAIPLQAISNTLVLLPFLFVLAMGLAGIAATLAAFASTHGEYFFAYQQVVQLMLLTFSTLFYPIDKIKGFFPSFVTVIVSANPLSLAVGAIRDYTFAGKPLQPLYLLNILVASLPFAVIGAAAYLYALRTFRVKGKI